MKKLIMLLILVPSLLIGQEYEKRDFLCINDTNQIKHLTDSLLEPASRKFVFDSKYINKNNGIALISYHLDDIDMTFHFVRIIKGEDLNLEIKGTTFYFFRDLSGKFLDILPIWNKYFDSIPNKEDALKQNGGFYNQTEWRKKVIINGLFRECLLTNNRDGYWRISCY
jgi:heme oxygenase